MSAFLQDTSSVLTDSSTAAREAPPAFRFSDTDTGSISVPVLPAAPDTFRLFQGHQLQPQNGVPVTFNRRNPDWFTISLFLVVLGFTAIRAFYMRIFRQLISAFFNNNVTNQIVRDENILVQRAASLMSVLFYFVLALFLYQVTVFFHWENSLMGTGFTRFFFLLLAIALAYSIKLLTLKSAGWLYSADRPVATYIFNIFLINNMLGLLLLPVVMLIAYVVPLSGAVTVINVGIVMAASLFVYRLFRGFLVWRTLQGGTIFYFILYLCTLELAPLLIIYKIAGG